MLNASIWHSADVETDDMKLELRHEIITHKDSRGTTLRDVLGNLRQSSDGSFGDLKGSTLEEN